jgi:hypothetical protein
VDGRTVEAEFMQGVVFAFPGILSVFDPADEWGEFGALEAFFDPLPEICGAGKTIDYLQGLTIMYNAESIEDGTSRRDNGSLGSGCSISKDYLDPAVFGTMFDGKAHNALLKIIL